MCMWFLLLSVYCGQLLEHYICLVVLFMCHFYCIYYCICEWNKWRWRATIDCQSRVKLRVHVYNMHTPHPSNAPTMNVTGWIQGEGVGQTVSTVQATVMATVDMTIAPLIDLHFLVTLLCPAPRVGGIKRWCTSDVCLSVAYIGPKSRTEA